MNYIIKPLEGKFALFCYLGFGHKQVSSYAYKDGKIELFEFEHQAISIGDKIILGNPDVADYRFEVAFMKAMQKEYIK